MLVLTQPCQQLPNRPARPHRGIGPGLQYLCLHNGNVGEQNAVTGRPLVYSYFTGDAIAHGPRGIGRRPTSATLATINTALGSDFTLIAIVSNWATGATAQSILDDDDGSSRVLQFRIYNNKATLLRFNTAGSVFGVDSATLTTAQNRNGIVVVARSKGTAIDIFVDGAKTSSTLTGTPKAATSTLGILGRKGPAQPFTGIAFLTSAVAGALSDAEILAICDNPGVLFEDDEILIFNEVSTAAALAGDATAQASASADLTTGIPILGAALAVSSGSAALTTGIPLAGAAAATSVASGQLVTSITLSGQALAQAVASAALSSGIILTADAVAQAAAQGTLATAIQLIGAATAQSSASGSLDAGASLAGNAQAQATASASLTVQIQLSAAALAQAAAAAGLTTAIPLVGAAAGQASATGDLTAAGGPAQLAGNAAAAATAGAVLTTGIPLTAGAIAAAIAAGSLTVEIRLSGQATADAAGNAALWTQIHIAGQAVALATASANLDTTASHWADGPVWMIARAEPLCLYQVEAAPAALWSPAVDVLAQYTPGVHRVQ